MTCGELSQIGVSAIFSQIDVGGMIIRTPKDIFIHIDIVSNTILSV